MAKLYIGLGSNLGNRIENINQAVNEITHQIGKLVSLSDCYKTEPWGFTSDNYFLNAVACVETTLSPNEILSVTQQIEKKMGRNYKSINGIYHDRIIDIDLLIYNNVIINDENLKIPHPLMTERLFVMKPLAQIAPTLKHPQLKKTMQEIEAAISE